MRNIQYSPAIDLLTVVENGSKVVKIYNTNCEVKYILEPAQMKDITTFVLATVYSEKENKFGCVTSDKKIYF